MTYKYETDVKEALAMAENLSSYVRGDQLYGSAGGGFFNPMPSLTIGALIMRLRRLDALRDHLTDSQSKRLDKAVDAYDNTRREWTHHYEEKMLREIHSRLDAMQTFFKECANSMANCANNYRPELLRRTIVQELLKEMVEMNVSDADTMGKVKQMDGKMRGFFSPDEFQWDDELKPVYDQTEFWWLYQKPPKPAES